MTAIAVPSSPAAIAVGGGSVWLLADGRVVRIAPGPDEVVARIDVGVRAGSETTCDLAVAGGVVWTIGTMDARRSLVVRLDGRSGRLLGATRVSAAACVAATPRGAWVTLPDARVLLRLDSRGRVVRRVPTDGYCDRIVAGHGAVWVACPAETAGAAVGGHTGTILRVGARGQLARPRKPGLHPRGRRH